MEWIEERSFYQNDPTGYERGTKQAIGRFVKMTLPAVDGEKCVMDALIQKTPLGEEQGFESSWFLVLP